MTEFEIIENKNLRDEYIGRVEVLNKVKALLMLPDINLATTQQVADFYGVDIQAIKSLVFDNKNELISDGYCVWKSNDFNNSFKELIKINKNRGNFEVEFSNGDKEKFAPRGVALFTRRAILRVGMLLRDSEVAKEVRTQLLNIEEKVSTEEKVQEINTEQKMILDMVLGKNEVERANAVRIYMDYKNRYINTLENKVTALTEGNLTWDKQESINRMVRKIAAKTFEGKYYKAWDKVYAEMLYKHNIGINSRKLNSDKKKPTIFDVLDEDEVKLLVESCVSLCEMYNIDISDLLINS